MTHLDQKASGELDQMQSPLLLNHESLSLSRRWNNSEDLSKSSINLMVHIYINHVGTYVV
jgi:hypothetical protein